MDKRTLETVEGLTPVLVPTMKLLADHHITLRHAKKQRDMELEIVEKKKEMQEEAAQSLKRAQPQQQPQPQQRSRIDELKAQEDCNVCQQILDYIDRLDGPRRGKGIEEYGRLKETMETAESEQEVRDFIDNSDVIAEALA